MSLLHLLHWFYAPSGGPWYHGAVWGNVFVLIILVPLGWLWSKTKYWPLGLIHKKLDNLHDKHDDLRNRIEELHDKHDHLLHEVDRVHKRLDHTHPSCQ